MTYFDGIKVGDKVWDFGYGWGKVVIVSEKSFVVSFSVVNNIAYCYDGKLCIDKENKNQTLFWSKINFEIPKPKIELNEKGYYISFTSKPFIFKGGCTYEELFGLSRNEQKTIETALKQIKRFTRLLALRDQECPDSRGYEFRNGGDNWFISYSIKDNKWDYDYASNYFEADKVYFKTGDDAQKICNILNSDRFDLEGEKYD